MSSSTGCCGSHHQYKHRLYHCRLLSRLMTSLSPTNIAALGYRFMRRLVLSYFMVDMSRQAPLSRLSTLGLA
jgi:hypothetical protein